jgi:hypothetical protein
MPLVRIVSGGQIGVDRAALDAALDCGLAIGGWCPKGRRAEDGVIAERCPLVETPSKRYEQRTRWNVRDSDATLILALGELSGGSRLTADAARSAAKPLLVGRLDLYGTARAVEEFVEAHRVRTLNVAGRASRDFARAIPHPTRANGYPEAPSSIATRLARGASPPRRSSR